MTEHADARADAIKQRLDAATPEDIAWLLEERERLSEALRPFASAGFGPCDVCYEDDLPDNDCRCSCHSEVLAAQERARAALARVSDNRREGEPRDA